jgi:hypothetical protein
MTATRSTRRDPMCLRRASCAAGVGTIPRPGAAPPVATHSPPTSRPAPLDSAFVATELEKRKGSGKPKSEAEKRDRCALRSFQVERRMGAWLELKDETADIADEEGIVPCSVGVPAVLAHTRPPFVSHESAEVVGRQSAPSEGHREAMGTSEFIRDIRGQDLWSALPHECRTARRKVRKALLAAKGLPMFAFWKLKR